MKSQPQKVRFKVQLDSDGALGLRVEGLESYTESRKCTNASGDKGSDDPTNRSNLICFVHIARKAIAHKCFVFHSHCDL